MRLSASVWKRILAFLFDIIVLSLILIPLQNPLNITEDMSFKEALLAADEQTPRATLIGILVAIITLLYFSILEFKYGQTLGKMLLKIKVVSTNKKKTFFQFLLRNLTKLHTLFLFLDSLYILRSGSQRFFDKFASTEVIVDQSKVKK